VPTFLINLGSEPTSTPSVTPGATEAYAFLPSMEADNPTVGFLDPNTGVGMVPCDNPAR